MALLAHRCCAKECHICKPEVATDACLAKIVGLWFINSRDRDGGRQRRYEIAARRQQSTVNENVEDTFDD